MAKVGRPTDYCEDVAKRICERISEGESLHSICRDTDQPERRTVHRWLVAQDEFRHQYAHAKDLAAELRADECLDIADAAKSAESSVEVQAAKLRIDTRQWYAKVTAPKKYGDKQQIGLEHSGAIGTAKELTDEELERIAAGSSAGAVGKKKG